MRSRLSDQHLPRRPIDDYADGEPLDPPPAHRTPLELPAARRRSVTPLALPLPSPLPLDHRCGITRTDLVVFAIISACVNAIASVIALEVLHALIRR